MLDGVGTLAVLLDVKLTVTPPVGATCDKVTVTLPVWPRPMLVPVMVMPITLVEAVALVMPV